jgi:hypothetical protein
MEGDQRERSIHVTPPESEPMEFTGDVGGDQGDTIALPDADDGVMPRNDNQTQEEPGGSKAKAMEQKHPNMYF